MKPVGSQPVTGLAMPMADSGAIQSSRPVAGAPLPVSGMPRGFTRSTRTTAMLVRDAAYECTRTAIRRRVDLSGVKAVELPPEVWQQAGDAAFEAGKRVARLNGYHRRKTREIRKWALEGWLAARLDLISKPVGRGARRLSRQSGPARRS